MLGMDFRPLLKRSQGGSFLLADFDPDVGRCRRAVSEMDASPSSRFPPTWKWYRSSAS
jgi:hypothetical protein